LSRTLLAHWGGTYDSLPSRSGLQREILSHFPLLGKFSTGTRKYRYRRHLSLGEYAALDKLDVGEIQIVEKAGLDVGGGGASVVSPSRQTTLIARDHHLHDVPNFCTTALCCKCRHSAVSSMLSICKCCRKPNCKHCSKYVSQFI